MDRKAFSFLRSFYDAAKMLSNKEEQADFLMAVCNYGLNGEEPNLTSGTAAAMFQLVKPNLDIAFKRAKFGSIGGQNKPKANSKQNGSKTEANASKAEAIKDKGLRIKDKYIYNNNYSESTSNEPVDNVDNSPKPVDNSDAQQGPANSRAKSLDGMDLYNLPGKDAFAIFREEYPRHQGALREVQTAWVTAVAGGALPGDLVMAGRKYARVCSEEHTEQKYIKMPQNFINSGLWKQYAPKYLPSCPHCHGAGVYQGENGMVMCECNRRYG